MTRASLETLLKAIGSEYDYMLAKYAMHDSKLQTRLIVYRKYDGGCVVIGPWKVDALEAVKAVSILLSSIKRGAQ